MITIGAETKLIQYRYILRVLKKINLIFNRPSIICIIITGIIALSSLSASDAIYIKPKAFITGKDIYLSNISKLPDGIADILLIATPTEPFTLTPEEVYKLLPSELADRKVLGSSCQIIPLNKKFLKEDIEKSFLFEISEREKISPDDIRITYFGDDLFFPEKGVELKWGNIPKNITPGQKIFTLDAWKDNNRVYSVRTKFLVELKINAPIANRKINRLQQISENDIVYKQIFISEYISDLFTSNIKGMTSLSNIEEGDLIRKKHLREIHTVERGTNIDIVFYEGNVFISTRAIARESGNTGDKIRVQSKSSGTLLSGIVTNNGQVKIE
jgi:flagella basal body P-ring formation protein FlgA